MKATDLAYYAGIIDGEGSIGLMPTIKGHNKQPTFYLRVQVVNTNEWLCQQLKFAFGGNVCTKPRQAPWKTAYQWCLDGRRAKAFLAAILPYLHLKRPQAELAITFQNHKTLGGRKSLEYIDFEAELKSIFTEMNRKGTIPEDVDASSP